MKKEKQIAEENIEVLKERSFKKSMELVCEEHKASCQRFLDWLIEKYPREPDGVIDEKITDLKQAIKLYDDTGIQ